MICTLACSDIGCLSVSASNFSSRTGRAPAVMSGPKPWCALQQTATRYFRISSVNAWNATLYDNLNFNFIRDIAPIAGTTRGAGVLVVHPSFPAKTISEFLAYTKANPGKINMASGGVGSAQHVWGELFKMMAGVDMTHVPYRGGGPALSDLVAAQVLVMFDTLATSIEYVRTSKLRALAVTTATRQDVLPDVPTIGEFVPGYEASGWSGVGAPRDTPKAVIDKLNSEINAALGDPAIRRRIAELGGAPLVTTTAEFSRFIAAETDKWAKVIKFAAIKAQ